MISARLVAIVLSVLAVGVGAGLLIAQAQEPTGASPGFASGKTLEEPPQVRSRNGVLKATLVARNGTVRVSGRPVAGTQTYAARAAGRVTRRGLLGPTLRVNPGDLIDLMFDNRLTVPDDMPSPHHCAVTGAAGARAHHTRTGGAQFTNLHFHGLHVTPRAHSPYGDSVIVRLRPGRSHIRFRIPADHDKGTFWYHAHLHGCTDDQVFRGLAGLLLIGDSRENLPKRFRQIRTRSLGLKDIQVVQPAGLGDRKIDPGHDWNKPTVRTINGQVNPTLSIRSRETQLWRLANLSAGVWYRVALVDASKQDARDPLTVVAQDGNSLGQAKRARSLIMAPGRRFDVLVRGPASGRRILKTLSFAQGHARVNGYLPFPEDKLATVDVAPGPPAPAIAAPRRLARPSQVFPKRRGPTRRFVFDFDERTPPDNYFQATINNQIFSHRVPGATPALWTTERWIIYNKTNQWHPFHIHQDDFRVTSAPNAEPRFGGVQDIVNLPPGSHDRPSRVEIEMPYTDFAGRFVFHCHILDHEDAGMMTLVQVKR